MFITQTRSACVFTLASILCNKSVLYSTVKKLELILLFCLQRCEKLTLLLYCQILSAPFHEPVSPLVSPTTTNHLSSNVTYMSTKRFKYTVHIYIYSNNYKTSLLAKLLQPNWGCKMFHLCDLTSNLCSRVPGSKLLPDHQKAHRPVSDPQETGQEQHSPLLHCWAVCWWRLVDVQELRYFQLRKEYERISHFDLISGIIELFLHCSLWR